MAREPTRAECRLSALAFCATILDNRFFPDRPTDESLLESGPMNETLTTGGPAPASGDVAFPPGRYGRRRQPRKRRPAVTAALTLAVVAGGVAASLQLADQYGHGEYSSNLLGYDTSVPGQVSITFEVFKPAGEGAICRVRSRDMSGAEIGFAEVRIPSDDSTRVETTYALAVTGDPNTGEVQRCWTAD
ncbi:hypothetical protein GCM10027447_01260 [Glycomyces halotolerans]